MPKNKFWVIITLALLASAVWVIGVLADTIYLPVVSHEPTVTPTITPTPTQTMTPTITTTPTRTPVPEEIFIEDIVNGDTENDLADEYILLVNESGADINLEDWRIRAGEDSPAYHYTFPDFTLDDDDSVRIWSKAGSDNASNLYMDQTSPLFDNDGDCAYLRNDVDDEPMQRFCYGNLERFSTFNP